MSYDLYLKRRPGADVTADSLEAYFRKRPNYVVENGQALYENEKTGVYFIWDIDVEEEEEDLKGTVAALNLNYYRPSFFVREAEVEVSALVATRALTVYDPQGEMESGEYDPELLKAGWHHGNRCACEQFGQDGVDTLPGATLDRAWQWNWGVPALQEQLDREQEVFVPRVMLHRVEGKVVTAAVWPDGIPIVVPPVECLIVLREEFAPKRLLRRQEDEAVIALSDAMPLLEAHRSKREDKLLVLDYDSPPEDVVSYVTALPAFKGSMEVLPEDAVLDQELFQPEA